MDVTVSHVSQSPSCASYCRGGRCSHIGTNNSKILGSSRSVSCTRSGPKHARNRVDHLCTSRTLRKLVEAHCVRDSCGKSRRGMWYFF